MPWGLDLAAAWSWRLIVIAIAAYALFRGVVFFAVVVLPLVIALLIAALVSPVVVGAGPDRAPRGRRRAFLLVVARRSAGRAAADLRRPAGRQRRQRPGRARSSTASADPGLAARPGRCTLSDSQISDYIRRPRTARRAAKSGEVAQPGHARSARALGHVVAGLFIVLFATYFFLADGDRIWAWVVRLFPRAGRARVDSSGRVAWVSLTQFVRATVIVAVTDAIGVMIVAAILRVPFVLAIGVLVFLGAFIPMIGAFVSGTVAVLVALVAHGPSIALIMLGGVVVVQQIEAHVLQPFLMGRFVSVHPLGVIVAIAAGVLVAGIAGALVAVPFAAAAQRRRAAPRGRDRGRRGRRGGARGRLRRDRRARRRHRRPQRRARRRHLPLEGRRGIGTTAAGTVFPIGPPGRDDDLSAQAADVAAQGLVEQAKQSPGQSASLLDQLRGQYPSLRGRTHRTAAGKVGAGGRSAQWLWKSADRYLKAQQQQAALDVDRALRYSKECSARRTLRRHGFRSGRSTIKSSSTLP